MKIIPTGGAGRRRSPMSCVSAILAGMGNRRYSCRYPDAVGYVAGVKQAETKLPFEAELVLPSSADPVFG